MPEHERDRLQVRAAIGGAANPTQVGFGVVGIDQASEAVMSVIDSILSARDAHFEARNRMTEQSDHWKARAEAAEAAVERVREYADLLSRSSGQRPEVVAVDVAWAIRDALDRQEARA